MKKLFWVSVFMCLLLSAASFAGAWEQNANGFKYKKDDGTYAINSWEWIDTNSDGVAECFYFNEAGLMLSNTAAPDGSMLNANGEWIVNGVVQTKKVETSGSNSIYAPTDNSNSLSAISSGDINVPGNTSNASAKKALDSLKAKCNNLVTKMASEGKKDMKQNTWDSGDIANALEAYDDEADLYLEDYEYQVNLIMIEYDLPRARKDNMMRDGKNVVSQGRSSLSTKLRQALSKNSD